MTAPDFREALDAAVRRGSHNVRTRDQSRNEAIADAVLALLAERLDSDEVRSLIARVIERDWENADYWAPTDAALAAVRDHLGLTR